MALNIIACSYVLVDVQQGKRRSIRRWKKRESVAGVWRGYPPPLALRALEEHKASPVYCEGRGCLPTVTTAS